MVDDLVRPITHEGYGKAKNGLQAHSCKVERMISEKPLNLTTESVAEGRIFVRADQGFAQCADASNVFPLVTAGVCYFTLFSIFVFGDRVFDTASTMAVVILSLVAVYFTVYFFTKPKKEVILNRMDGLITFDGFHWQPNITMRFDAVIFHFSSGGGDGAGSFDLLTVRPTNHSYAFLGIGANCYIGISFLTWYMDKNRPLPPRQRLRSL